ncbi:MAG: WbuC family cupin fold metalloprotein, partial [Tannerella sp.]|nr:WbuC family cupin fold metalloprotein [Tannerella sp.]
SSPRLRMNHNFHDRLDDPLNRLINAIEPDSYLRPHRHINAGKTEIFLLLRGKAALFLFDDEGNITEQVVLDPLSGVYGGEIEPEVWHTLIILETGSVVYEVKTGPFTPLAPDEFASWSPAVEDVPAAQEYMNKLKSKIA